MEVRCEDLGNVTKIGCCATRTHYKIFVLFRTRWRPELPSRVFQHLAGPVALAKAAILRTWLELVRVLPGVTKAVTTPEEISQCQKRQGRIGVSTPNDS